MDREFGDLFTFRAGKIIRLERYWNRAESVRAAGAGTVGRRKGRGTRLPGG
jgi:ketosteroid isomerase-like protein